MQGLGIGIPVPSHVGEEQGVARFVEVGAGGVLIGLLRSINPMLQAAKFGTPEDLDKAIEK